MLIID